MADAFPDKEQEDADNQIQKKILDIKSLIEKRRKEAGVIQTSDVDVQ